jgi:hypothetical protein
LPWAGMFDPVGVGMQINANAQWTQREHEKL